MALKEKKRFFAAARDSCRSMILALCSSGSTFHMFQRLVLGSFEAIAKKRFVGGFFRWFARQHSNGSFSS